MNNIRSAKDKISDIKAIMQVISYYKDVDINNIQKDIIKDIMYECKIANKQTITPEIYFQNKTQRELYDYISKVINKDSLFNMKIPSQGFPFYDPSFTIKQKLVYIGLDINLFIWRRHEIWYDFIDFGNISLKEFDSIILQIVNRFHERIIYQYEQDSYAQKEILLDEKKELEYHAERLYSYKKENKSQKNKSIMYLVILIICILLVISIFI